MRLTLRDPAFLASLGGATYTPTDTDAITYIAAVEAADGQALESGVRAAIDSFFIDSKADGYFSALKAACILMGARTLSGALVPMVGTAPTNVGFVSGDYNRKTGLLGSGTKYLNSNRNNNADPQNNRHLSVYVSALPSTYPAALIAARGSSATDAGGSRILLPSSAAPSYQQSIAADSATPSGSGGVGFYGASRSGSTTISTRSGGSTATPSETSGTPSNVNLFVFARNTGGTPGVYANARMAFYSIGESLTLSLLDSRITALYNAIAAAIP